jgi:hypothetical protein
VTALIYVDVRDPLRNVYDTGDVERLPNEGDVIDFGLGPENTMHGVFEVLSMERVYNSHRMPMTHVRCNVARVGALRGPS